MNSSQSERLSAAVELGGNGRVRMEEARQSAVADERSIVQILTDLWEKTESLVRQEMKLASAELDEKLDKAKRDLITLGLAGGALFAGFGSFVAALILLLSEVMAPWLAAGIVSLVSGVGGYLLLQRERHAVKELAPTQTIESVKSDVRTIREATHDSV